MARTNVAWKNVSLTVFFILLSLGINLVEPNANARATLLSIFPRAILPPPAIPAYLLLIASLCTVNSGVGWLGCSLSRA